MQLIFLSTMEQRTEERTVTAQVSITEEQGCWRVLWSGESGDGRVEQECWHEGFNWKEMLHAYRQGLLDKRSIGFIPLVDTAVPVLAEPGKQRDALMLQFYGEKHRSEELFELLRRWRRQQAAKEGKSPFFVATNRMLYMVSAFLPKTVEELRTLPGFGQRKVDAYGKELLELAAKQERTTGFPLNWVFTEVDEREFDAWLIHQQRSREQQDQQREFQRKKALETIAAGCTLSDLEQAVGLKRSELVRLVEELDRAGYDVEPLLAAELDEGDAEQEQAVQQLFAKHGGRFLKPVLRELFTEEELKGKDHSPLYERLRLQRIRYLHQAAVAPSSDETAEQPASALDPYPAEDNQAAV